MFDQIPVAFQYLIMAETALVVTIVALWGVNRVQARRKRAGELADELTKWGLVKLATPIRAYSQGDYSEAVAGFVALAKEIKGGGAIALLEEAVRKCVEHYAAGNATMAQELIKILQDGAALKAATITAATTK
jgi:hypothetical protein